MHSLQLVASLKQFSHGDHDDVERYNNAGRSKHQQGDKRDGVDFMITDENRDGVMEHQKKHQSYSNYATADYTFRGGSLAIVFIARGGGRTLVSVLCLDVCRSSEEN